MSKEISRSIVIASQKPDYYYTVHYSENTVTISLKEDGHTIQEIKIPIGDAAGVGRAILDVIPR